MNSLLPLNNSKAMVQIPRAYQSFSKLYFLNKYVCSDNALLRKLLWTNSNSIETETHLREIREIENLKVITWHCEF